MPLINVKTGVLFRDSIVVQDPSGAYVTGLVNANFTRYLSNGTTGNLATTGIVITEVSAVNNPGVYDLLIPASILSANGNYTLLIFRTAAPTYSWYQEYVATQDGLPASSGTLSFTSTAGDGRVVDTNGTAISGATVYITSGNYLTALTTDSNGEWGPWYSDASAGAFTITVVASTYTQGAATLSVGASSITGPGANVVLTAISTGSTVTASELWSYARRMANNKPGSQADLKIKQLVNDALDRISKERDWNWYMRRGYLSLQAAYATGTITLTNGSTTCTLATGTWPTWAASGRIFVSNIIMDVSSRTSGTVVLLAGAWGGTTGSYSYTIFQDAYTLPTNYLEFGGILEGQSWPYKPEPVSIQLLWKWQNALTIGTQYAQGYSIAYNQLFVWPYPTVAQSIVYMFKARPAPLTAETDIADIDPTWIEVLRQAINYYVALYFGESVAGNAEQCLARYVDSLARLPANDKSPSDNAPVTGGYPRNVPLWRSKSL